eukprot:10657842-Alexandrium_andersonii.AAC.1
MPAVDRLERRRVCAALRRPARLMRNCRLGPFALERLAGALEGALGLFEALLWDWDAIRAVRAGSGR